MNKRMKLLDIENLYQLDPLEEIFYYLYSNHISIDSLYEGIPVEIKEKIRGNKEAADTFMDIISSMKSNYLEEKDFVKDNSDIDVLLQPRFFVTEKLHNHDFFEIEYILKGECEHKIGDMSGTLKAGDICFIAPNVEHRVNSKNQDTIVVNIIVRSSTFHTTFKNLLGNNDVISVFFAKSHYGTKKNRFLICKTGSDYQLDDIVYKMIKEVVEPEKFSNRFLKVLLENFFILLLRKYEKNFVFSTESIDLNNEIIDMLRYIEQNYKTASLSSVAKKFNYSDAHFSRMIKKYTGRTFSEIHKNVRVNQAADLLMDPSISIQKISEEVGYTDTSHFYRTFKKFFDCTPVQYRNMHFKYIS